MDGLCQQMDIGPAILEMAGVTPPKTLEAISLLPAIEGQPWEGRPYVFAEQAKDGILTGAEFMTMVRSDRWKIVHFMEQAYGQLFNLADDPTEINDLWDSPDHQEIKQEMLAVLREWRIRSQYDTSDWCQDWR